MVACCSKFLYIFFKAALNGAARAAAWARVQRSAGAPRRPRNTPGGWRGKRKPKGPPQNDRSLTGGVVGRQPAGRRGQDPRDVGERTRIRRRAGGLDGVAATAPPAGAQQLQDGRGFVGGLRSRGGCGEPSRLPSTRASRADHRPARQRPYGRQGRLDVAGRAVARFPCGRVDGRQ
jgi:hypothetical protein